MERNQVRTSGNVLLIISLVSTLPNYFPFKIHLKYPIFFSEPGCGRATPARSPTRWEYPICRFCSRGAKPPRTPAVVLRPPSPTHRRNRGAASAYPYASKRGSKSRVGEQVDRLANQGRAFSYTLLRLSPPHPGEQD